MIEQYHSVGANQADEGICYLGSTRRVSRQGWGGLLLYRLEGVADDMSPLPFRLFEIVERDVADLRPRDIAFDFTEVSYFRGCPVGFLARPCGPVREMGGQVYILGKGHAPWVQRILEMCCIMRVPITAGAFESLGAVEAAIAAMRPQLRTVIPPVRYPGTPSPVGKASASRSGRIGENLGVHPGKLSVVRRGR